MRALICLTIICLALLSKICLATSPAFNPQNEFYSTASEIEKKKEIQKTRKSKRELKSYQNQLVGLDQSISLTKNKITSTRDVKYLPDLYLMLAELLNDKCQLLYLIKKESNRNVLEQEIDFSLELRAKQDAIDAYKQIEQRFPNYPLLDKVLFIIGSELRALNNLDAALQYFKKAFQLFPKTTFGIKSAIEIGNVFFDKKDFDFALEQYKKASLYAEGNDILLVYNKIAACYSLKGQWNSSFGFYQKVIKFKNTSQTKNSLEVIQAKEEALIQSVWPFLELSPSEANSVGMPPLAFYKQNAFDKESYRRTLERLARRFDFKKKSLDSAQAYLELFRISTDSNQKKLAFEAFFNLIKDNKQFVFPDWLSLQIREMLALRISDNTINNDILQVNKDKMKYEEAARYIITTRHRQVVAQNRKPELIGVIKDYNNYLATFPKTNFFYEMAKNKAEVEYLAEKYMEAAKSYVLIAKSEDSKSYSHSQEYYDSAIEALVKVLTSKEDDILSKTQAGELYRKISSYYEKNFSNDSKVGEFMFNRGKILYDQQRLNEAATELFQFVSNFPRHEYTEQAAILVLDCYYLQEKMSQLTNVGQKMIRMTELSEDLRAKIQTTMAQAQLKSLKSLAGQFATKKYATQFKKFADKNKYSKLGEQALFEAFESLRATFSATFSSGTPNAGGAQPEVFRVGQEYIDTYGGTHGPTSSGDNPRAKNVLIHLGQLHLTLLNFNEAAFSMVDYGQKFPNDANSKPLLQQAATMYSKTGKALEAFQAFESLGLKNQGLAVLTQWQRWDDLYLKSTDASGLTGQYYQGLSLFRLKSTPQAFNIFENLIKAGSTNELERGLWSHAGIILVEAQLNILKSQMQKEGFSTENLQKFLGQYEQISATNQKVIKNGSGTWRLGALLLEAHLNMLLAEYLKQSNPPPGMSQAQFKTVLDPQIKQYSDLSHQYFSTCVNAAEENALLTGYAMACRTKKLASEASEFYPLGKQFYKNTLSKQAQEDLKKNPKSAEVIKLIAIEKMRANDNVSAIPILGRAQELDPNSSDIEALTALAWFRLGADTEAMGAATEAVKKNANDLLALEIQSALYAKYGYIQKQNFTRSILNGKASPYASMIQQIKQ